MANDQASSAAAPDDATIVADRLHSAAIHLLRRLRREDGQGGVGPARLSALSVLVFGGPLSLGRLAAAEQVRPPTMSRIVAALEEEGLVVRRGDPADARQVVLRATRAGARVLRQVRGRRIETLARRLRPMPAPQLALLAEAAAVIEQVLRRREGV